MLKAYFCDEVCGKKNWKERSTGHMVVERGCKGSDSKTKGCTYKEMCKSETEANKARYKNTKNRAKKVVSRAIGF